MFSDVRWSASTRSTLKWRSSRRPRPLQTETKRQIYQEHRRGEPVECWPGGSAGPARASTASSTRCAPHESWNCRWTTSITSSSPACVRRRGRARSWARRPKTISPTKKPRLPSGLPAYMASLYEVPLLTREQEAHLFRKMNYLKYQASKLRETLDVDRPKRRLMDRIENLYEESVATKNQIISANLRLVVSIAKRYIGPAEDFFELVSDGNMSLIRAVEKFDVSRGNRFSTYATWAIMKNFARSIPAVLRHRDRFSTSHAEVFGATVDLRADPYEQESRSFAASRR